MTEAQTTPEAMSGAEPPAMPLMEHLKELRNRLIRAVIALFITTGISFAFAKHGTEDLAHQAVSTGSWLDQLVVLADAG